MSEWRRIDELKPTDGKRLLVCYRHGGKWVYTVARWRRLRQRAGDWLSVPTTVLVTPEFYQELPPPPFSLERETSEERPQGSIPPRYFLDQ